MDEKDLQVFISAVGRYFQQMFHEDAVVDVPFLQGDRKVILDFTGMIGISGTQKGAIYFTASTALVDEMLKHLKQDITDEKRGDIVGELANTISGNARREFGKEFHISVPMVIRGAIQALSFPKRVQPFVIPFGWRSHKAYLIVGLVRE